MERLIGIAVWLYGKFLWLYPAHFRRAHRREMTRVFRDLCHLHAQRGGIKSLVRFWLRSGINLLLTAAREHAAEWRTTLKRSRLRPALSLLLLSVSGTFFAVNTLQYTLGVSIGWNPFDDAYAAITSDLLRNLFDMLIVLGPAVALALLFLPYVYVQRGGPSRQQPNLLVSLQFERITIQLERVPAYHWLICAACALTGLGFALYLIAENSIV